MTSTPPIYTARSNLRGTLSDLNSELWQEAVQGMDPEIRSGLTFAQLESSKLRALLLLAAQFGLGPPDMVSLMLGRGR